MTSASLSLPVVRPLPKDFSVEEAFWRFANRPGCLWLDSAARGPRDSSGQSLGRYSFLTADPIDQLVASVNDYDPWPTLDQWCQRLPKDFDDALPSFQGGIAGLVGYEAARWLEPVGLARVNDLPTPALSLGLYDWTIAVDHETERAWIIAQGLAAQDPHDLQVRHSLATQRIAEIEAILFGPPRALPGTDRSPDSRISDKQNRTRHRDVVSDFTSEQFRHSVAEIVQRIRNGDFFQVNLAQRLLRPADRPSAELYSQLRLTNPAPFGAFYNGGGFEVLSSSPEGFLKVRNRHVETRPIKGTVPRTGNVDVDRSLADALRTSEKDRAENIMIVDLMRNDLSRVCTDDSVQVSQLCEVERYEYVQHLVSVVEGELCSGKNVSDLLRACFPGGSVTGAPKIEAMRTIAELEPHARGPYCGSIGYIGCGDRADFNVLIRTITATAGYWQIPVGGGITARSKPAAEEDETWSKAEGMLRAFDLSSRSSFADIRGTPQRP